MSDLVRNARFIDERALESDLQIEARHHAIELGLAPLAPSTGSHLAFLAAATNARHMIEVGSGVGVTSLWLHRGAPNAELTSIDIEPEFLAAARQYLLRAGARSNALRLIAGDPLEMLPRMSEDGYDLVVLGSNLTHVAAYLQHALRIVRQGGTIVVLDALNGGRVSDPTKRDTISVNLRAIIAELDRQPDLAVSILPGSGGLLQVARIQH